MMSRLVDPAAVHQDELMHGDVLTVVVTLHVMTRGDEHIFRMYRCSYPPEVTEEIPQGSRIAHEKEVAQELFPVVIWAGMKPDLF